MASGEQKQTKAEVFQSAFLKVTITMNIISKMRDQDYKNNVSIVRF